MLAVAGKLPADSEDWAFEIKWDGVRAILFVEGGRVRAQSRNDLDVTVSFPELADIGKFLGMTTCVIDGEIVALGEDGRPSFSRLQRRMHVSNQREAKRRSLSDPVTFVAFDLLYIDGHSLLDAPYDDRRERLESLHLSGETFTTTDAFRDVSGQDILTRPLPTASRASSPSDARRPTDPVGVIPTGRRSSPSARRRSSSAPGRMGRASVRAALAPSCSGSPTKAGCATSARSGPASARGPGPTSSTTSRPWRRRTARSSHRSRPPTRARPTSYAPSWWERWSSANGPRRGRLAASRALERGCVPTRIRVRS